MAEAEPRYSLRMRSRSSSASNPVLRGQGQGPMQRGRSRGRAGRGHGQTPLLAGEGNQDQTLMQVQRNPSSTTQSGFFQPPTHCEHPSHLTEDHDEEVPSDRSESSDLQSLAIPVSTEIQSDLIGNFFPLNWASL